MVISDQELSILDFKSTSSSFIRFPSDSSTEARISYTEIEWINYCPDVFRILQEYGKIEIDDYMISICGNETLRQLHSHGKCSSLLYLSHDDRFVIKTIHKHELKVFLEKLPNYYHHVRKYRNTLLTKYYGLHVVKQSGGQKVYFVVMGNVLHSDLCIHKRFDLKGSSHSHGHSFNKAGHDEITETLDDLDIVFHLDAATRNQLLMQIKHDCDLLEDIGTIDYCLLLGIHLSSPSTSDSLPKSPCSPAHLTGSDDAKSISSQESNSPSDPDQDSSSLDDLHFSCHIEPSVKMGVRMGAHAVRNQRHGGGSVSANPAANKGRGNNVVIFFEIIDIFHVYNMVKRVENVFKSLQLDSQSTPGGNPKAYSARFQDFICQIFPENKARACTL